MSQHFLLSATAKTLSLSAVARMSDEEARATFQRIRWSDHNGEPYCPKCGCAEVYTYSARALRKCKGCQHQFSVTSGTIFASRKLAVRDYLLAIAIFVNGVKGHSALQLSRDLQVQYKTAFVLSHKIREAILAKRSATQTIGGQGKVVEIDGGFFGGHVKPSNRKEDRKDRRRAETQTGKRQCVVVIRERNGKTLPFVLPSEDAGMPVVRKKVALGTVIQADEAAHWDALQARYETKRINHSQAYSRDDACTNWAESFFSRLRRAEIGIHHHVAGPYLDNYASEMSWREDNRRVPNGELHRMLTEAASRHPVSEKWCGYWQRGKSE